MESGQDLKAEYDFSKGRRGRVLPCPGVTLSLPVSPTREDQLIVKSDGQQVGVATPSLQIHDEWILWGLLGEELGRFHSIFALIKAVIEEEKVRMERGR